MFHLSSEDEDDSSSSSSSSSLGRDQEKKKREKRTPEARAGIVNEEETVERAREEEVRAYVFVSLSTARENFENFTRSNMRALHECLRARARCFSLSFSLCICADPRDVCFFCTRACD